MISYLDRARSIDRDRQSPRDGAFVREIARARERSRERQRRIVAMCRTAIEDRTGSALRESEQQLMNDDDLTYLDALAKIRRETQLGLAERARRIERRLLDASTLVLSLVSRALVGTIAVVSRALACLGDEVREAHGVRRAREELRGAAELAGSQVAQELRLSAIQQHRGSRAWCPRRSPHFGVRVRVGGVNDRLMCGWNVLVGGKEAAVEARERERTRLPSFPCLGVWAGSRAGQWLLGY